jgi:hypothetical protein
MTEHPQEPDREEEQELPRTDTDVDEVESGEQEPGRRSDEVERAAEREDEALEG